MFLLCSFIYKLMFLTSMPGTKLAISRSQVRPLTVHYTTVLPRYDMMAECHVLDCVTVVC